VNPTTAKTNAIIMWVNFINDSMGLLITFMWRRCTKFNFAQFLN
jgi:hypothetical protein